MQNNISLFLKNKYFLALCLYLKKTSIIYNSVFIGYKNNYLILNIPFFIHTIKILLNVIQQIALQNGTFLFLATNNKVLNYIIQQNCIKYHNIYLNTQKFKQTNLLNMLNYFPDLIISTDSTLNYVFLKKLAHYNIPTVNITSNFNVNFKTFYTLIFNNQSLYSNLILYTLIFNQINQTKKVLGVQYLIQN